MVSNSESESESESDSGARGGGHPRRPLAEAIISWGPRLLRTSLPPFSLGRDCLPAGHGETAVLWCNGGCGKTMWHQPRTGALIGMMVLLIRVSDEGQGQGRTGQGLAGYYWACQSAGFEVACGQHPVPEPAQSAPGAPSLPGALPDSVPAARSLPGALHDSFPAPPPFLRQAPNDQPWPGWHLHGAAATYANHLLQVAWTGVASTSSVHVSQAGVARASTTVRLWLRPVHTGWNCLQTASPCVCGRGQ